MVRLTFKADGVGYTLEAPKEMLIARLGPLEEEGSFLIMKACDRMCKNRKTPTTFGCQNCPLRALATLINGRGE